MKSLVKTYHVHHILTKERFEAEDLLRKLEEGKEFSELARKFSLCRSAYQSGDLGQIKLGQADSTFEEISLELKPGEVTKKPIRTRFGFHIIKRIS